MTYIGGRGAQNFAVGYPAQLNRIISDQAVAALDELNGRLALADTGIAQNQDALAVDLDKHAVAGDAGGQLGVQGRDELPHQSGRHLGGHQDRYTVLLGKLHHFGKRLHAAGQHDGRRLEGEQLFQMGVAQ